MESMVDDYIRRQEMLDAVEKLNIIPSIDGMGKPTPTEDFRVQFLGTVLHVPPADVAPVVRCKDCKSRRIDGYCTKFQNNISGIAVSWFMPKDDGFCSYGKRKGE